MTKAAELAKMGEVLTNSQIGGRRNIIINGGMTIDQRNSGSSINLGNGKFYAVDRFYWIEDSSETPTGQQVTDAPDGFTHSVKITNTSTTTTPSYTQLVQPIEGNNVSQLYFGNSSAQNMTLSFYVKSSLTGQFSVAFRNGADNRSNVSTYTINSANTWERKIITFVGDTTGTYATDNTVGLNLIFRLDDTGGTSTLNQWTASANAFASGSVRFMGNASATWQVTGIQLEVGRQATPFEHRSFGEELLLCQRYYRKLNDISVDSQQIMSGGYHNSTQFQGVFRFEPHMRAAPSLLASTTSSNNSSSAYVVHRTDGVDYIDSIAFHQASKESTLIYTTGNTSGTQGVAGVLLTQESDNISELAASAEL